MARQSLNQPGGTTGSSLILDSHLNLGLDNAAQTIPSGGDHPILFDTIEGTHGSGDFTADTTTGTITVLNDGLYLVQTALFWADNTDGVRVPGLVFNPNPDVWNFVASGVLGTVPRVPTASGFQQYVPPVPVPLTAGTTVNATASQSSGVPLDVTYAELTIARLFRTCR